MTMMVGMPLPMPRPAQPPPEGYLVYNAANHGAVDKLIRLLQAGAPVRVTVRVRVRVRVRDAGEGLRELGDEESRNEEQRKISVQELRDEGAGK